MTAEERFRALSDHALAHLGGLLLSDDPEGPRSVAPKLCDWLIDRAGVEQARRDGHDVAAEPFEFSPGEMIEAAVLAARLEALGDDAGDEYTRSIGYHLTPRGRQTWAEIGHFAEELRASFMALANITTAVATEAHATTH